MLPNYGKNLQGDSGTARRNIRVVQGGVTTQNGNGLIPNTGTKIGTVKMPVQPRNKNWRPDWHPSNPLNQNIG